MKSPARFLWKGRVENMDYMTITSFTTADKKDLLTQDVEANSTEEVPMIRFVQIEANSKLSEWIDETLA